MQGSLEEAVRTLPLSSFIFAPGFLIHLILMGVEWPEGTAPSGSHRSVRESLDSYGSSCPPFFETEIPVRE